MFREKFSLVKEKIKEKYGQYSILYIYGIVVLLVCLPLTVSGFFSAHDAVSHFARNYCTMYGLRQGQFVPLICSEFCGGFGYAWNIFYPPLGTYISTFFYLIVRNMLKAMKLTIIFTTFCSGLFMFNFVKDVSKNKKMALMASILYITSIYYLNDVYMRMAMGEVVAYMFLPLLFHGLYDIFYEKGRKNYLLTIGAVGVLLSHNITAFITVILSMIFILFNIKNYLKKRIEKEFGKIY